MLLNSKNLPTITQGDRLLKSFVDTSKPAKTPVEKLNDRLEKDQALMSKGICPSCCSNHTHTEKDYFNYFHSEFVFYCDGCGYTAGGW